MTFEEQFPSLKDLIWRADFLVSGVMSPEAVSVKHVVENCLDKQRVKSILYKLGEEDDGSFSYKDALEDLESELGL